ncbi:LuxR C-terminal-related transcriptional regulator [Nocardia sp. NPDC050406]|uniref:helix-turn-helix transcriptional regulator n=1 Tax=Nocardia sp. NPDC050406 TaxID=3364318 RepID=UPI0037948DCD
MSVVGEPRTRARRPDDDYDAVAELLGTDPARVRIARAVAVLGPAATADRVRAILGTAETTGADPAATVGHAGAVGGTTSTSTPPVYAQVGTGAPETADSGRQACTLAEIASAIAEFESTGLFDDSLRADPAVAARLLGDLPDTERRDLHRRAAHTLHGDGFPPAVIAPHLVAAGDASPSWATRTLLTAADDAIAEDQLAWAGKYFELAYRGTARARDRATIATRLVAVDWRANPSSRTRNFGRLKAAVNAGLVAPSELPAAALYLLWHGCAQHADRALSRLDRETKTVSRAGGPNPGVGGGASASNRHGVSTATPLEARRDEPSAPAVPHGAAHAGAAGSHPRDVEEGSSAARNGGVAAARGTRENGAAPVSDRRAVPFSEQSHEDRPGASSGARESVRGGATAPRSQGSEIVFRPHQAGVSAGGLNSRSDDVDGLVGFLCAWLRYTHPTHVERHRGLFTRRVGLEGEGESPHWRAGGLLGALLTQRPSEEIGAAAQRLLAAHRLSLTTVEPLVAAVDCLIHTDRLDSAEAWCTSLLAEAQARHAPTWRSIFAAARAETLLRKGNLGEAAENAVLALNSVPADHLGVWVGRPIAVLVRALTMQGKHAEAAAQLRRPVPRALFDSRFALGYSTAYGEHCLATGRPDEALRYFRQCGNLMRQWGMDYAWLEPWRNHVATAYLSGGRAREARAFASMHLDLIGGAEGHRSGGVSLRLLAATSDPHRRVSLLRRSVAAARAGDSDLELAAAQGDLGRAYRAIGDADRARPLLRDAIRLAEQCDAQLLLRRLRGDRTPPETLPIPRVRPAPTAFETLSPAERRVAELAALGQRNRDIAAALAITTSTVEQHLTKVYRKLSVARRGELRFVLAAYVESTRSAVS